MNGLLLLLLTGCGTPDPVWTEEGALSGVFQHLDKDQSGGIESQEWPRALGAGPVLAEVDASGNGQVDIAELTRSVLTVDPLTFLGGTTMPLPPGPDQPRMDPATQSLRELFHFLVAELEPEQRRHSASLGLLGAAVGSGRIDSPDSQAFLNALAEAYHASGRPLPEDVELR
jgi:hypothetical protein